MKAFILLISLLSIANQAQASLTQNFDPDVIRCEDKFYYIGFSSPTLSRYFAATGNREKIASYQIINDVLTNAINPQGSKTCENQTVQQLWASKRAYRIQNWGSITNRSVLQNQGVPDAIKCQNKIALILYSFNGSYLLQNPNFQFYKFLSLDSLPQFKSNFECQKSLDQFKADGEAYNLVSQVVKTEGQQIHSMSGRYPDVLSCQFGVIFFIHSINDQQSTVTYRGLTANNLLQIKFNENGSVIQSVEKNSASNCQKSLKSYIEQRRAFNLNNYPLRCPNDITTVNPVVNFLAKAHPKLTVTSTPASGSTFNLGTTQVKVEAKHSNGSKFQCTFKLTRQVDGVAPKVVCPQNIKQKDSFVFFDATATDNSDLPIQISYNKQPGSKFSIGDTMVKVKATDFFGNQSVCNFMVTITISEKTTAQVPVIGIVFGVLAGAGAIAAVVVVLLCKKYKKGCFKVQDGEPIVNPLD